MRARWQGELRGAAESSELGIEVLRKLGHGHVELGFADRGRGRGVTSVLQARGEGRGLGQYARMIFFPILGNFLEQSGEARTAPAVLRREIGAGKERFLIGGEEHGHGPATLIPVQRQRGLHVDLIKIGPLFAIDFDADEMLIHDPGDRLVLKRFPLHDMTPMAGGIADREENRPLQFRGLRQRFRSPGIPIHRVIGVLQEIGTSLLYEAIRLAAGGCAGHARTVSRTD